ncbi:unnamed protein product [Euphydryas editha]|uniref:Fatty acid desaturase domain-containing protein n=1 Tax=Euphydryas editha TaxID=104508 RepID=A0AAU9TKX2_EUPED|nr:unnamed protein product [Euphydryas editha]
MQKETKTKAIHSVSLSELFQSFEKSLGFKNKIKWQLSIIIFLYHVIAVFWCYKYAIPAKWQTIVFAYVMYIYGGAGVVIGAHRLWTHKTFKVKLPLQILLLTAFASAGQNSVKQWVLDHRVHHKCSDTDGDPHNSSRGLFFSHIGWLMMKKNDQVLMHGKQIDISDITEDPVLHFFDKYFTHFKLLFCFILPFYINVYLLGETWQCAIAWQWFIRFLTLFHSELTVNSLAHAYGYRPYNKDIVPTENIVVSALTLTEGGHNFHHAFPFDYRSAEQVKFYNLAAIFINVFEKIGWAYDLRKATPTMINSMAQRLGDGSLRRTPVTNPELEKEK